jgi:hypothetical protein
MLGLGLLVSACSATAPATEIPATPMPIQSAVRTVTPGATPTMSLAATRPPSGAPSSGSPSTSPSGEPSTGAWTVTGSMITPRTLHTATLLPDGRVLVTGGVALNKEDAPSLSSAELYDPQTGLWTATGGMHYAHAWHSATLLANGTVLVAGGRINGKPGNNCPAECPPSQIDPSGAIAAAETYDPGTGAWTVTGSMTSPRFEHTATMLDDGRVLVVGAELAPDLLLESTEIYDPQTGVWSRTGDLITRRWQQYAVALPSGQVLVCGGYGPLPTGIVGTLAEAELYDPHKGEWRYAPDLLTPRAQRGVAVSLADGTVLLAGGDGGGDHMLASTELYNPDTGGIATASMSTTRGEPAGVLLADGRVLVVGGFDIPGTGSILTSAETYDPATGTWKAGTDMQVPRFDFEATLLADGRVVVTGGAGAATIESSAEIFDPTFSR